MATDSRGHTLQPGRSRSSGPGSGLIRYSPQLGCHAHKVADVNFMKAVTRRAAGADAVSISGRSSQ